MPDNSKNLDYLKRKFLEEDGRLLILSITKRCNLNCLYCRSGTDWYDRLSKNTDNSDLNPNNWEEIVQTCKQYNIKEILLTGGEPVAYQYINELLVFLHQNNIRFSIHTNGVHKSWNYLLHFLKLKNIYPNIALSLELFNDLQKTIRGCQIPYDFIDSLILENFNIELKVTVHQDLLKYKKFLKENLLLWYNKGVKSIRFQPVVSLNNLHDKELALKPAFIEIIDELIMLKKNDLVLKDFIRNSVNSFEVLKSLILGKKVDEVVVQNCVVYDKVIFINSDYKILNCKSLWERDCIVCTENTFDYVCCGFLS